MKKHNIHLPKISLIGLSVRTNNADEMNPDRSKIASLWGAYLTNQTSSSFKHRATPGVTYSVYTQYDSDEHGEYTYFIGEAVESLDGQDLENFHSLTIPESHYTKFTTQPGPMPSIVIQAWQDIWKMSANDLGGRRAYLADFEVYDHRASDPSHSIVDIYIGLK